ncbi:MAG: hypothetical protein ACI8WB_003247 [Phenylobacterium sp.]|jgi:hypothetical protein
MQMINFIDKSTAEVVHQGLNFLCENLRADGIQANWYATVQEAQPGAILLLHDPVDEDKIPPGCQVIGQRCLNRRERLVLAERCGLPVATWCALDNLAQIPLLFDRWEVDNLLFKADWSYSRGGIKRLTRDDHQPFCPDKFNPDGDIFMKILDGSPDTYKVDLFYDQPFACRHMHTRSVFDKKFYNGFYRWSQLGTMPPLEEGLKKLGKELFFYGQGFSGADVMYDKDNNPWIIELNTSSLGRENTWHRWPEQYLQGYLLGLRHWIKDGCPAEFCHGISPRAALLDDRSGGDYPLIVPQNQNQHQADTQIGGISR